MNMWIKIRFIFSSLYWKMNYQKIASSFFTLLGTYWLIIELLDYFFGNEALDKYKNFWIVIVASVAVSVLMNLQKLTYSYFIKDKDIKIKLVIGDIFKQHGDIVIATNTTFDTTMENDFISKHSIQGKLFLKYYSKIEHLDKDIECALKEVEPVEILDRKHSKCKRYEIGTTIKLKHNDFKSYWLALSDVNEFGKPFSSFSGLQSSLESLWSFMSTNGHMDRLVLPILGSGRSSLNESREKILKEIIYSFVSFSRERKITEELVICISPNDYVNKKIDLCEIDKFLEYHCLFKHESSHSPSSSVGI